MDIKKEKYIKNKLTDYKEIYGNKGVQFCLNLQKKHKKNDKKQNKVQFSDNIEYSRN